MALLNPHGTRRAAVCLRVAVKAKPTGFPQADRASASGPLRSMQSGYLENGRFSSKAIQLRLAQEQLSE